MSGPGFRVLNDPRKEPAVRMIGVDMPAFHGTGYCVGGDEKASHVNVTESDEYKSRMTKQMEKVEANCDSYRVISREFKSLQGRNYDLGGRLLHSNTDSRTGVPFSRLVDPTFLPDPSDEMSVSVSREEATLPNRLILVFKKMTETEIAEEKNKAAPKLQKFWPFTGSKEVLGGRSESELKDAFRTDRRTDSSTDDGRFYFVWGKKKNANEYGEISVALRPGVGISVECVPPVEANDTLPAQMSIYGRRKRRTQFFDPSAHAMDETHAIGMRIESISARLNGGLFRVTALMTEDQLRECETGGELIEKFNRVLKAGSYRKLRIPQKK